MSLINEKSISGSYKEMSELTLKMLSSVDYDQIKRKRIENFEQMHSILEKYNKLKLDRRCEDVPYCYPILINSDIKSKLLERNIYVPTLWKERISDNYLNTREYELSKLLCCVPIDQRYNKEDIHILSDIIIQLGCE